MTQLTATERGLSDAQVRAVELMVEGRSNEEIANTLGVDRTTVWRWRTRADVRAEVRRLQTIRGDWLWQRIERLSADAVSTLEDLLADKSLDGSLRLRAAQAALEISGVSKQREDRTVTEAVETMLREAMVRMPEELHSAFADAWNDVVTTGGDPTVCRKPLPVFRVVREERAREDGPFEPSPS